MSAIRSCQFSVMGDMRHPYNHQNSWMRYYSYLGFFVVVLFGPGTAFQQKLPSSVEPRTHGSRVQRPATCLWQTTVDRHQTAWNDKYEELVHFYKQNGHLKVEYKSSLYNWIINQRTRRAGKKNQAALTDEQIRLLDDIDFHWAPVKSDWQTKYEELSNFYKNHGHTNVEYKSSLYNWIMHQRNKRETDGIHATLSEEQIRLLDKIDFPWTPRRHRLQTAWNAKYQELTDFYEEHGHVRMKRGTSLYWWTVVQRRKRAGIQQYVPLTMEQIRLLDKINFTWNPKEDKQERLRAMWQAKYRHLAEFYNKHGHLKVKYGSGLYTWMANQRQRRVGKGNLATLTDEQVRLLDEVGFSWAPTGGPHETAWHTKYRELANFYKQHGHTNVTAPGSLYTWTVNQRRRQIGKGDCVPLNDEQIRLLDDIGFPWAQKA